MQILFVRIPEATKKLLLAEVHAGRYRNQAEAANALLRAGLDSLTQLLLMIFALPLRKKQHVM